MTDTMSPAHQIGRLLIEAAREQISHEGTEDDSKHEQESAGGHEYADDPGDVTDEESAASN